MNLLYLSALGGGLDTNVRVLGPALVRAGHRVSVLYVHPAGHPIPSVPEIEGCGIYHASMGAWHYYLDRATLGRTALPRVVRELEHAWAVSRVVSAVARRERVDLVELPEVFATPRLMCGIPYVVRLHSAAWIWRQMEGRLFTLADSLEIRMERRTLLDASGISSPSLMLAGYIRKTCGVGSREIEIIPYPIDTQEFRPGDEGGRLPMVLFVGRVEKRKGADVLLQAVPRILSTRPEAEFVFIGRVCDDVKDFIPAASSRVRLLGVLPHREIVRWYQRAAVFAAPSLWDNSPNTIYEAMACGTPVVGTRVGGIPELVDEGSTGILVPPSNPGALADAIHAVLGDGAGRTEMAKRAREKAVDLYSLDRVLSSTLDFYAGASPAFAPRERRLPSLGV